MAGVLISQSLRVADCSASKALPLTSALAPRKALCGTLSAHELWKGCPPLGGTRLGVHSERGSRGSREESGGPGGNQSLPNPSGLGFPFPIGSSGEGCV